MNGISIANQLNVPQGDYTSWCIYLLVTIIIATTIGWLLSRLKCTTNNAGKLKAGKTLIILGSGGHTKEILNLTAALPRLEPRVYVSTLSDKFSITKAKEFEKSLKKQDNQSAEYYSIIRIRDVGQSFVHAFFIRAPKAFYQSVRLFFKEKPDILLCNGPGVCVPFCFIAAILNAVRITKTKIIFVESICRVKSLSMTGKIVIHLAHDFIVQWDDLQRNCNTQYPKANVLYLGRLS